MLQNAYFIAKIGADTAENEQTFAEILPTGALVPPSSSTGTSYRPREGGSAWRVSNGAPIRGFWQVAGAHGTRVGGRAGAREEGVRIGKFLKA